MEQKSPGIYILEPLTLAKGLDFEIEAKKTVENTVGPCGEHNNRTPFLREINKSVTFYSCHPDSISMSYKMVMDLDRGSTTLRTRYSTALQRKMTGASLKKRSAIHYLFEPLTQTIS